MSAFEFFRELLMKICFSAIALIGASVAARLLFAYLRDGLRRWRRLGLCGCLIALFGIGIAHDIDNAAREVLKVAVDYMRNRRNYP